ncbi:MAG: DUF4932 domain-containing protein [Tunicatimonas sp.]
MAPEEANRITFLVDDRLEFFRTVFNVAHEASLAEEDATPCETEYAKQVADHFAAHQDHPLIDYVRTNDDILVDFSTVGLMFTNLDGFVFDDRYADRITEFGLTKEELDSIRPLLTDFYETTGFAAFFQQSKPYYREALRIVNREATEAGLFRKVTDFYQSDEQGLALDVFVELTNNINNKAVDFYDHYNPRRKGIILANVCDVPSQPVPANTVLALDNDLRGRIYHETSHLFTDKLLSRYLGDLNQYQSLCADCGSIALKDEIDHLIVYPLQALLAMRLDQNREGHDYFTEECTDVRATVYRRLTDYRPENGEPFVLTYAACMELIKDAAAER